jgi:nucleoside-diphosphate-sugar epimerase
MLKGSKILVTGLTGNLGGSLAEALSSNNEVWGFARFSREGQLEYWKNAGVHTVAGNLSDGVFEGLPDDFDYVINSAANTAPASFEDAMRDNAEGTGLLMAHCRKAKAFLHFSAAAVYAKYPDLDRWYKEGDLTGSAGMGHYNGSKLASEGVVRAMARHLGLPSIICRMGVQYGKYRNGGLPGIFLKMMLNRQPIILPASQDNRHMLISDDDVVRFLEPALNAASVPALTINFAGDEAVSSVELIEYLAELVGIEPDYAFSEDLDYPTVKLDPSLRQSITGLCEIPWREGVKRMVEFMKDRPNDAGVAMGESLLARPR